MRRPRISPLRYPGGKASLFPRLRAIIRANSLSDRGTYVEPYAGGAGAAIGLLVTGEIDRIVINDLDPAIYAFWRAVVHETAEFVRKLECVSVDLDEWRRQKEIFRQASRDDYLSLGFATFFLNRTNVSGALNGGVIGGKRQQGTYRLDARFNKPDLLERIRLIGLYARKIAVNNVDGVVCIEQYSKKRNVLIYADPPYFERSGSLYLNSFSWDDHVILSQRLNALADSKWILTYDDVPHIDLLYRQRRRERFAVGYSAHRVVKTQEVMIFSDGLTVA